MSASVPSQTVFSIGYDFHFGNGDSGNPSAVTSGQANSLTNNRDHTRDQTFTYDQLNRLISAQNAGTDCTRKTLNPNQTEYWGNSYGYDAWGNLLTKSVTKCSAENLSETADAQNRMHAVSGADYSYDAAGNMTGDVTFGHSYAYDAENRVVHVDSTAASYTYNSLGNRVRKDVNGGSSTEYFNFNGQIVAELNPATGVFTNYVFFDGDRVARRDGTTGPVSYYFSDHLKTASVITDAAGNIQSESDYYPWGGELQFSAGDPNHYKFTGKERDSETGLDYSGARYYSNGLGRFITPDWSATPVPVPYVDLNDPQTLNQYSYVRNIPTVRIDADGHCPDGGCLTPPKSLAELDQQNEASIGFVKSFANVPIALMNEFITMGQSSSAPIPTFQPSNDAQAGGMIAGTIVTTAYSTMPAAPGAAAASGTGQTLTKAEQLAANAEKGAASEARVLKDMGLTKNTDKVAGTEGKSIPDINTKTVVGDIKDAKTVSNTQQIRIQKEAAQQSGRQHVTVTGTNTHVTKPAGQGTALIRRDDLGPQ